jgi:hypothetical protein
MPSAAKQLVTVGQIAQELNEPLHRIEYVLRTRDISPCGIAGNCRVYTEEDIERVAMELRNIDAEKDRTEARRG